MMGMSLISLIIINNSSSIPIFIIGYIYIHSLCTGLILLFLHFNALHDTRGMLWVDGKTLAETVLTHSFGVEERPDPSCAQTIQFR